MVAEWFGSMLRRARGLPPRDARQCRHLSLASVAWVVKHRAWNWWYLLRYVRLLRPRLLHPHIVKVGMVFLGRRVELMARPGYGRLVLGR